MVSKILGGVVAGMVAGVIGFGIVILSIIGIFFFAILGALIGAVTGMILQFTPILGEMVIRGFEQVGVQGVDLAEIGAMLGFVAGFFKSATAETKEC